MKFVIYLIKIISFFNLSKVKNFNVILINKPSYSSGLRDST